ncbi:adenine DNA glycosylase-like isoform X2 [Mercenaria mercenaria]|uniref:adenine DNA glycosylase-like isoform X2 n=1 Tax=Mercenaria mercenaria TaxID=6596 RepID=UPI00234EC060|nr:adenine DNA glycosylase-like isoform X2 [Mercenaria mercenaria]
MVKRKNQNGSQKENKSSTIPPFHNFTDEETKEVRTSLVSWYNENKRDLPWRRYASHLDINERAYAVWVSEIMLQQTQVATVIDYYNKWMKKWPTVQDLAKATLEEVNEMWSGLGYYSRGRRLFEGAKKVAEDLNGEMPKDAESLLKQLPGVGKYTAGAIASIAYNEATGLVDGNVIRVLCRLRMIGAESNGQVVTDTLSLANNLVDPDKPGDFNQGMMELGATVCTPKSPECSTCPLKNNCKAFAQVEQEKRKSSDKLGTRKKDTEIVDIECLTDKCQLCLPDTEVYDSSQGVMNYPRKGKKKAAREESTIVCVTCRKSDSEDEFLITQRPEKGLLAGLWEFPSYCCDDTSSDKPSCDSILQHHGVTVTRESREKDCGEVVHIFSHIHQTYLIKSVTVDQSSIKQQDQPKCKWVTRQQFMEAAVSTAMKKVFKAYEAACNEDRKASTKPKGKIDKNQKSIQAFFKPKAS